MEMCEHEVTNPMEELRTTTTHEASTTFTSTETATIISIDEVSHTEETLSSTRLSTAVSDMVTMTEAQAGMTKLESTTGVMQTPRSGIWMAVIQSREGFGSQLQFSILVCNPSRYV